MMIVFLALGAMLAQAQTYSHYVDTDGRISKLVILSKSHVTVIYDTVTQVRATSPVKLDSRDFGVFVEGSSLFICDSTGSINYELHVIQRAIKWVVQDHDAVVTYPDGGKDFEFVSENNELRSLSNQLKGYIDELTQHVDSVASETKTNSKKNLTISKKKRHYSTTDRLDFDFLWGFHNWGDAWYNGLMKMDGAYQLRTTFSSYQLAMNYSVVMTKHWEVSLGMGYESDVFKFSDPYVTVDGSGQFVSLDAANTAAQCGVAGSNYEDWSTRFVARYVTLPIELRYRDIGSLHSWGIALGVVPGLSFNSRHTGLKHELDQRNKHYQDVSSMSQWINAYKMDVRLTIQGKGLGFFVQMATLPLFVDTGVKVYPIKIGFIL